MYSYILPNYFIYILFLLLTFLLKDLLFYFNQLQPTMVYTRYSLLHYQPEPVFLINPDVHAYVHIYIYIIIYFRIAHVIVIYI